jgi:hypothetical protein
MPLRRVGLLVGLCLCLLEGQAQPFPALPPINTARRGDLVYFDSLARVLRQQQQYFARLPRTPQTDSAQLRASYQLCRMYPIWSGRRDSTRIYIEHLLALTRRLKNPYFEANGKLLLADYYRTADRNTPEALRLCLEVLHNLPATDYTYLNLRYRGNQILGTLYDSMTGPYNTLNKPGGYLPPIP